MTRARGTGPESTSEQPSRRAGTPRAAVVWESMFGNTALLGRAIGAELRTSGFEVVELDVTEAPPVASLEVDLLVVGAPTHAFSLSRPSTRADAVRQGADEAHARIGVREWLGAGPSAHERPSLALFDTRVAKVRHLPGSAARAASRIGSRNHVGRRIATESFYVEDVSGPLVGGELERAHAWARDVALSYLRTT